MLFFARHDETAADGGGFVFELLEAEFAGGAGGIAAAHRVEGEGSAGDRRQTRDGKRRRGAGGSARRAGDDAGGGEDAACGFSMSVLLDVNLLLAATRKARPGA